eukprot:2880585-Rhodomonas_salina.1
MKLHVTGSEGLSILEYPVTSIECEQSRCNKLLPWQQYNVLRRATSTTSTITVSSAGSEWYSARTHRYKLRLPGPARAYRTAAVHWQCHGLELGYC